MKALIVIVLTTFFLVPLAIAQEDFDEFIELGSADATVIYEAYATPAMSGLNWGFNRGWYQTAKAHKPLGFDFSLNVAFAFIPESDEFYSAARVEEAWLANATALGTPERAANFASNASEYPTFVGPQSPAPEINIYNPETDQFEQITGPVGFDFINDFAWVAVPVAMPQFGIGLIKNTDLKFRFLPKVGSDDEKVSMFGVGLMHDIKQWIPGNSVIPLDISLLVAYSNVDLDVLNIDDDPGDDGFMTVTNWTGQLLVSHDFFVNILTLYGGFGYNHATNKIDIVGEYNIIASAEPIVDPVSSRQTNTGFNGSFGARAKFGVLTINAEYSIQEYNTFSAGIGVSVR